MRLNGKGSVVFTDGARLEATYELELRLVKPRVISPVPQPPIKNGFRGLLRFTDRVLEFKTVGAVLELQDGEKLRIVGADKLQEGLFRVRTGNLNDPFLRQDQRGE